MKPREKDSYHLGQILWACQRIVETLEGVSLAVYLRDSNLHDATVLRLIVLGNSAHELSSAARGKLCEAIPWKDIVRLRHKAAHHYAGLTPAMIYQVGKENIPELLGLLRS